MTKETDFDDVVLGTADAIDALNREIAALRDQRTQIDGEIRVATKLLGEFRWHLVDMCKAEGVTAAEVGPYRITRKTMPDELIIEDESLIPVEYAVTEQIRSYNKGLIKEALKAGQNMPGASLKTERETIQIRFKKER